MLNRNFHCRVVCKLELIKNSRSYCKETYRMMLAFAWLFDSVFFLPNVAICIAKFGYCHGMSSVCDVNVLWFTLENSQMS